MTNAEIVRGANGRVAAVQDGPYKLTVARNAAGHILGVEGRSKADDALDHADEALDRTEELATRADRLETDVDARLADLVTAVGNRATSAELGQHFDQLLAALKDRDGRGDDIVSLLQEQSRHLEAGSAELHRTLARLEGWKSFVDGLEIHTRAFGYVGAAMCVTWPVTLEPMTGNEPDDWTGCRCAGSGQKHVIRVRTGRPASDVCRTIIHELAHCRQAEQLLNGFDAAYLADDGVAIETEANAITDQVLSQVQPSELVRQATVS
ncbi:MAG TPA: hypothetical protein VFB39_07085 [Solirubrobacteraceae bacterium]|nr:hypothetical protein [Solirubrobacteraceae bacterium]